MTPISTVALQGIRVLDLTSSVAGQYCGRLLADYGAAVTLIERTDRVSFTRSASIAGDPLPPAESFLFFNVNRGKLITRSDPAQAQAAVTKALQAADVILLDESSRQLFDLPVEFDNRITCVITPFGADRIATEGTLGNELIYQALAGTMYQNGDADVEPLYGVGHRASYAAGTAGYVQILACLWAQRRTALIDVAIAEVATSMNFNCITQYGYSHFIERRGDRTVPRSTIRCSDGWVTIFLREHRWPRAMEAFGLGHLTTDPRFTTEKDRLEHWDEFEAILTEQFSAWEANDVVRVGQSVDGVIAKAKTLDELLSEPHLVGRGFWSTPQEDFHGLALTPLGPVFPTPTAWTSHDVPPRPVQTQSPWRAPGLTSLPLDGLRVLDCTTAWAGPMAAHYLGELGADVIHVEGPGRIDDWRGNPKGAHWCRYPDGEHGDDPYNRNCQFNTQNTDKRGICVDVKDPRGRAAVADLAAQADVVMTNFRSGWLVRSGFDDEFFSAKNPGALAVEMSAYGPGGELTSHAALGPSLEMMSGHGSLIGYGDGRPISTGPAYLDPIGALNGAAAILTGLLWSRDQGSGGSIELAQRESAMHWIGDELYRVQAGGTPSIAGDRPDVANRIPLAAPHGAYRTAGEDQWIAIAANTDEQFMTLRDLIGDPRLADDAWTGLAERKSQEALLNQIISEWTAPQDKQELTDRLRAAGVPAAVVADAADLHASAYLRERDMVLEMDHPACGRHLYQGLPLHISGYDLRPRGPAPKLGEHTEEILTALGIAAEDIADLKARSVITDYPLATLR